MFVQFIPFVKRTAHKLSHSDEPYNTPFFQVTGPVNETEVLQS